MFSRRLSVGTAGDLFELWHGIGVQCRHSIYLNLQRLADTHYIREVRLIKFT